MSLRNDLLAATVSLRTEVEHLMEIIRDEPYPWARQSVVQSAIALDRMVQSVSDDSVDIGRLSVIATQIVDLADRLPAWVRSIDPDFRVVAERLDEKCDELERQIKWVWHE